MGGLHLQARPARGDHPGVRLDYFGSAQKQVDSTVTGTALAPNGSAAAPSVDPRLATRIRIVPGVTSVEQVAVSHQPPSFIIPVPGLQVGSLSGGLQTVYTLSQGFEVELPYEFRVTPTVFTQSYTGLTDLVTSCIRASSDVSSSCLEQRVRGRTYGLEVLLKRALTKRFTGWLAYTLSSTTRDTNAPVDTLDISKINPANPATINSAAKQGYSGTIPGEFDRRHVLNVIGAFDLGKGFRAGGRFVFYTGTPYSPKIGGVDVAPYNSLRLPDFWRFDIRLEKKWLVKSGSLSAVIEWMNVAFEKEADTVNCSHVDGQLYDKCTPDLIGPITIPSIGLEGVF